MKPQKKNSEMTRQIQRIQSDAQQIASEADSLAVTASPAAISRGKLARRVQHLQARVDRLRHALWRVQTTSEAQVVPFPSENSERQTEPSLVDRVLALLDRRCG
jgi:hypothetical protein